MNKFLTFSMLVSILISCVSQKKFQELVELKNKFALGELKNPMELRNMRRKIARLKTKKNMKGESSVTK